MGKTNGFARVERVKQSEEIQRLFKKGRHFSTNGAMLFVLENELGINRIAFALKKGYGNAVTRNASKRLSREAYRKTKQNLLKGYDMVLLIYPGNDTYLARYNQINNLFKKAGLLLEIME